MSDDIPNKKAVEECIWNWYMGRDDDLINISEDFLEEFNALLRKERERLNKVGVDAYMNAEDEDNS